MDIRGSTKISKLKLVQNIEQTTTASLFSELLEDTRAVISKNTIATLGFDQDIGIIYQGVRFNPKCVKPLSDGGTYLPMHKSMSGEFSAYLTKHRDTLNAFSVVRNMLLKSVTIAFSFNDMAKLTTLPLSIIEDSAVNCGLVTSTLNSTMRISEDDIKAFQITHNKAVNAIEYYSTFTQLFGDIEV